MSYSVNNLIYCLNINNHRVHEYDSKRLSSVEWVKHYLEAAICRSKNTRVLISVFGETQEIEFVQSNDGQSHTALQTLPFPSY